MKNALKYAILALLLLIPITVLQNCDNTPASYSEKTHYSKVLGKEKSYRIYLPSDYKNSEMNYPVIYFFHGWGGRHFMDPSAQLDYERVGEIVNKYNVIMVMWDGNIEESERRPYNIGNHHDVKYDMQMHDYFPEFVAHIDSNYRTRADREHRGILGFSMGGFMSYYISGKYPEMVSAAVNFVGSPEFFVGLPENHTLYQLRYTFDNLQDVSLQFINRTGCPLTGLNNEVHQGALWTGHDDYTYRKLEGEHKIDNEGEIKVFDSAVKFVVDRFNNPKSLKDNWTHYDITPDFMIKGYHVTSNKNKPGFLCLKNVNSNGFGFYSYKYLPNGLPIENCEATITTPPNYNPNQTYTIKIYNQERKNLETKQVLADESGRLRIDAPGTGCEVGIVQENEQADFGVVGYQLNNNEEFLKINQPNQLKVKLFNRSENISGNEKIIVRLSCNDSSVNILNSEQELILGNTQTLIETKPFKIESNEQPPSDGSPAWLKMRVAVQYKGQQSNGDFILPVYYDVPYFENIKIDDGIAVSPTHVWGDYSDTTLNIVYGTGNGDGIISSSEQIMLYEDGHRLRLYTEDPFVVSKEEKIVDEVLPAIWPDGFTLSSVVKIVDNCPDGHVIEFLGHYETKTRMPIFRNVTWGKIKVKVQNKPPGKN